MDMIHEASNVKIGLFTVWAIGVGSALGGDFFGWQFILYGGFVPALFGVIFTGLFYWLYSTVMMELAARYRSSGGSFEFVRNAIGGKASIVMAILGLLKLILANSANALAISSYLVQAGMSPNFRALCWVCTYGLFTFLDCVGVKESATIQVCITAFCVLILIFYCLSSLTAFDANHITSSVTNGGFQGFMKGLPFSLQFFDGFEEVPLLMGYTNDPEKTIPKGLLCSYITIAILAFMILVCGSGVSSNSALLESDAPLMLGFNKVYGNGSAFSDTIAYLIVIGLIVNFFAFILFVSQQIQAVAQVGFLPNLLRYRHPVHEAPVYASIAGSVFGVLLTASFAFVFGDDAAQNTLVTAALMPAALGYILVLECIIRIRQRESTTLSTKVPSSTRLGHDPGPLRFKHEARGARVGQFMCLIYCIGLLYLACISLDFFYGLVSLLILSTASYLLMYPRDSEILEMSDDEVNNKSLTELELNPMASNINEFIGIDMKETSKVGFLKIGSTEMKSDMQKDSRVIINTLILSMRSPSHAEYELANRNALKADEEDAGEIFT